VGVTAHLNNEGGRHVVVDSDIGINSSILNNRGNENHFNCCSERSTAALPELRQTRSALIWINGLVPPEGRANPVPATLALVVPGNINPKNLGTTADVFVTDAKALQGLNAKQIADKLTVPQSSSGFKVIEFPTPSSGIASPVLRNNPGFVGGGRTAGGAPEFVIPNGPVPAGATTRIV